MHIFLKYFSLQNKSSNWFTRTNLALLIRNPSHDAPLVTSDSPPPYVLWELFEETLLNSTNARKPTFATLVTNNRLEVINRVEFARRFRVSP
jgi:hypothetical protein